MFSRFLLCSILISCAFAQQFSRRTFSDDGRELTPPSTSPARLIADGYIRAQAQDAGLAPRDLEALYIVKEYRTSYNGVRHLVYRQQFDGIDVWHSDFTVNIDSEGRVISSGGQFYQRPEAGLQAPNAATVSRSLNAALGKINPRLMANYGLYRNAPDPRTRAYRLYRAGTFDTVDAEPVWYPVNGRLRPAWIFYIPDENGVDFYAAPVDSELDFVFRKDNLTLYQSARVFERASPQPPLKLGILDTEVRPYVDRTMQSFKGDATASPNGWVSGSRTEGNNAIAAPNPLGITFNPNATPVTGAAGVFDFSLALGPSAQNPATYAEAATTNLFYWTNLSHDLFHQAGFDEQAGSYQTDNFNRGGVGGDPMYAFSQFGSAANSLASLNNAFFTTTRSNEDGAQGSINMYIGGDRQNRIFTDGSYDAEVIVHEYTHGVSTRIVRQLGTQQGRSMGEAWSDFFSLEFTLPEGAPAAGSYPQGEYLFQGFGTGIRTRPYSTDMKVNPLTYAQLGNVTYGYPEVHADGEIWVECLWDMRANLIGQFGEKEGRRRARLLTIDGMKLSPPAPTMVDMRDAILLADRTGFKGASQDQIWSAFAKRGMGALAYSPDPDSVHIRASFAMPSAKGQVAFFEDRHVIQEAFRIIVQDSNQTADTVQVQVTSGSGDLENVVLRRKGGVYTGTIPATSFSSTTQFDNRVTAIPGDIVTVYYTDFNTGSGDGQQVYASTDIGDDYSASAMPPSTPRYIVGQERPLISLPPGATAFGGSVRVELPFSFPFYGSRYRYAWVSTTGVLTLGEPNVLLPCNSNSVLNQRPTIAPMMTDLQIGGSAQANENIYISTGADFVTFHWVAETQPYGFVFGTENEPVDFNVTLFDDGRIMFQYGKGNKNITSDRYYAPAIGCEVTTPLVGIANGHGGFNSSSLYPYLSGRTNFENAGSYMFSPPFGNSSIPSGQLEQPAAGDTVKDVLTYSGVAWDQDAEINGIDVMIDGMFRGTSYPNFPRPDFCATQRVPGCPFVGFTNTLNLAAIPMASGTHTIQLRVRNTRGGMTKIPAEPRSFTVDAGQARTPVAKIESPADGASLSGNATITGYAYSPDLRVSAVNILVDGVTYAAATYGATRTDVCQGLTPVPPNCPRVGFTATLATATGSIQLANGPHALQVRVRDSLGRYFLYPDKPLSVTVDNPANVLPKGVLESPKAGDKLSGMVNLAGYAWDPDGRVLSVSILVDGISVGTLRYGTVKADACAVLPEVTACPNIGFEGTLDTRRLTNGPHVLGVGIRDNAGNSVVVPQSARNGMSVVIEN